VEIRRSGESNFVSLNPLVMSIEEPIYLDVSTLVTGLRITFIELKPSAKDAIVRVIIMGCFEKPGSTTETPGVKPATSE
jgi:hypothetical protein